MMNLERILTAGLLLASIVVFAHGDGEHVKGTVKEISATSLTVVATGGNEVRVALLASTRIERGKAAVTWNDIRVGERVVIDVMGEKDSMHAMVVKLGRLAVPSQDGGMPEHPTDGGHHHDHSK